MDKMNIYKNKIDDEEEWNLLLSCLDFFSFLLNTLQSFKSIVYFSDIFVL